jgi:cytochrome P450
VTVSRDVVRSTVPPGPVGRPITGNLREFRADRLGYLRELAATYGDVVRIKLLRGEGILLVHPDAIEEVLVTKKRQFIKGRAARSLRTLLGTGLLTSEGDFWRRQRRLAQPAFHRDRIANYSRLMVEYGERTLAGWQDGAQIDVHEEMMRLTLAIVAQALFSADVMGEAAEVGRGLEAALRHFNWWSGSGFLIPLWMPFAPNRDFARARKKMDSIVYDIIAARRASGEDTGDLLSMLLAARDEDGAGMTDKQLHDEILTLLLAGHETTANALTWTFLLLAENPEVEAKLTAELQAVLDGRSPTLSDLSRLPYTEMVIKESMRVYPPVWILGYEATEDTIIAGYHIPKGTEMLLSQWVTHHDARWFPEPDVFRPERWASPEIRRLPTYAYFPFGGGERMCIGRSFAMMEAVLLLATIAGRYRLTLVPGQTVVPEALITLRVRDGLMMTVHER